MASEQLPQPSPDCPHLSFSQEGKDMVLRRIFESHGINCNFNVDVGAYHSTICSNTAYFYGLGWRGINIDACPGSTIEFDTILPDDINLELAIGTDRALHPYYTFIEPLLNTFDIVLRQEMVLP